MGWHRRVQRSIARVLRLEGSKTHCFCVRWRGRAALGEGYVTLPTLSRWGQGGAGRVRVLHGFNCNNKLWRKHYGGRDNVRLCVVMASPSSVRFAFVADGDSYIIFYIDIVRALVCVQLCNLCDSRHTLCVSRGVATASPFGGSSHMSPILLRSAFPQYRFLPQYTAVGVACDRADINARQRQRVGKWVQIMAYTTMLCSSMLVTDDGAENVCQLRKAQTAQTNGLMSDTLTARFRRAFVNAWTCIALTLPPKNYGGLGVEWRSAPRAVSSRSPSFLISYKVICERQGAGFALESNRTGGGDHDHTLSPHQDFAHAFGKSSAHTRRS